MKYRITLTIKDEDSWTNRNMTTYAEKLMYAQMFGCELAKELNKSKSYVEVSMYDAEVLED